jgi:hypothetical protein
MNKYQKRTDYFVSYEIAKPGVRIHNFLENADYTTDEDHCVILTGTVGEQWTVGLEAFKKKYAVDEDQLSVGCTGRVHPKASAEIVFAEPATEITEVVTKYGARLTAQVGDMIAYGDKNGEPDENKRWVISKEVFQNTYEQV